MYGYEQNALGYPDNLSISSTETAATLHQSSSSAISAQNLFKMNSAFIPDDSARLGSAGGAAYASVDASGIPLLDHQHSHQHQQQPAARFSSGSESRNQTPAAKRTREDEESDGNESDGNSRGKEGSQTTEKRAGRRKIKIEYIEDKSRRHITFSKRKAGIMKKAYELSTLTGTQVLLLVVSETGLVYTFTTPKLQPIVTQPEGKNLIQTCLNVPDTPGERIAQPVPTESNSYMSQPRQSQAHSYANPAAAAVAAAAAASNSAAMMSGGGAAVNHDLHHGLSEEQNHNIDSPATAAAVAAASNTAHASYLQYPYGQNAVAQAAAAVAAAASAGTPGAYHPGVVSQAANGVNYTPVAGYTASYPGSTSQSQHHSPIPGALSHTPHSAGGNNNSNGISAAVAAATSSIPGMNSLNSYHHGYGHPHAQHQQQQQQQQQNHYSYQSHHHQPQGQYQYHGHSQQHDLSQGSTPGTPLEQSPAGTAAVAAAVAAAAGGHASGGIGGSIQAPGNITTSYMAANHYWSPGAIASPHPGQQQTQQPTSATGLVQRTGYASGN